MTSTPQPPHEDAVRELDWKALRDSARRLLRRRMSGFDHEDLEDAVQDAMQRMLGFIRRQGRPRSPEGLLVPIVFAVRADAISRRIRDRRIGGGDPRALADELVAGTEEDDILEEYRRIVFQVREYFRLKRAGCIPLAEAKSSGETLKAFAERLGQSYAQVRQAWSRCVKLIHDAIRRKRLRIFWIVQSRGRVTGE